MTIDLDDAKYDRKLKRSLLSRRKARKRGQQTSILSAVAVGLMFLFACGLYSLHHRHTMARQAEYQRVQRAERMWKSHHKTTSSEEEEEEYGDPAAEFSTLRQPIQPGEEPDPTADAILRKILDRWLDELDRTITGNLYTADRWTRPYLLPPLKRKGISDPQPRHMRHREFRDFFTVQRETNEMAWETEEGVDLDKGPPVDYANDEMYSYPDIFEEPDDTYPELQSLEQLMENWPQDEDLDGSTFEETLLHFNFSNPHEIQMALNFRDAELPFKLYDIPDIDAATDKWTDDYLSTMFEQPHGKRLTDYNLRSADGTAQESATNYFAFHVPKTWHIPSLGLPPTRNNNWDFATWARHARYADAVRLDAGYPHFYWQAGVPPDERSARQQDWTFITNDLRLFSAKEGNFFVFHPEAQKGIQCRFGERGVVAATHYDGGRNMVGMITGAKRYILSPPNQCSRLGIFTERTSPIYRHSLLNFGHLKDRENERMSAAEQAWLDRAAESQAVETVLKAGEVLYIPSHWFHYIVSLQKSAQCNVRSGISNEGNPRFGGRRQVEQCLG